MLKYIDLHTGLEFMEGRACVLCLGNFDGVHIGHSALIDKTIEKRDELGILGGAWCFGQPPADFLLSTPSPKLTTLDEKLELFAKKGLDIAVLGDFSELRNTSPEDFVNDVLKSRCKCKAAVCGFNFRFGKGGSGLPEMLSGFEYGSEVVDPVTLGGDVVSSSSIRRLLISGDAEAAAKMLGAPYFITGEITHGRALGKRLGMPTINLEIPEGKLIPRHGVYASLVELDGKEYAAVSNVGSNPTVGGNAVRCETHILDFDRDVYGARVKVSLCSHLRDELHFSSTDELVRTVERDISNARKYFAI